MTSRSGDRLYGRDRPYPERHCHFWLAARTLSSNIRGCADISIRVKNRVWRAYHKPLGAASHRHIEILRVERFGI